MPEKPTDQANDPAKPHESYLDLKEMYRAVTQHWTHSEQIRWQLLYNYLVANSILVLAWATVFASNGASPAKSIVLLALCAGGIMLSLLWAPLEHRASGFVKMYADHGSRAELSLPNDSLRPFSEANAYRDSEPIWLRIARSRYVSAGTPIIFLILYIVLLIFGRQ